VIRVLFDVISSAGTSRCSDALAWGSVTRQGTTAGLSGRRYTISKWMADGTKRFCRSPCQRQRASSMPYTGNVSLEHLRRESL
ncbi:hypothetical protein GOODEAATRI_015969, partial [Goodea atripinnis]